MKNLRDGRTFWTGMQLVLFVHKENLLFTLPSRPSSYRCTTSKGLSRVILMRFFMTNARSRPRVIFFMHVKLNLQPPFRSLAPFIQLISPTTHCLSRMISIYLSVIRVMGCDYPSSFNAAHLPTTVAHAAVLVLFVGTKPTTNPPT